VAKDAEVENGGWKIRLIIFVGGAINGVLVIPDIIAFTISGITDIIAISDISTSTIGRSKKCKKIGSNPYVLPLGHNPALHCCCLLL